jgi:hypothetical protein
MVEYLKSTGLTTKVPFNIIYYFLPAFFIFTALLTEEVTIDFGLIALVLGLALIISVRMRPIAYFPLTRFVIYFTAAILVYLFTTSANLMAVCGECLFVFYVVLAVLVAIWVRFSGGHFKFNSLDFLILIILVMVPNLPMLQASSVGLMALEIMILFYASEVVISENSQKWTALHSGVLISLVSLAMRGIL